jgi:hypothetical protein
VDHWGEFGEAIKTEVFPRRMAIFVSPFQEKRVLFRTKGALSDSWMVAKLAANGEVRYARVGEE